MKITKTIKNGMPRWRVNDPDGPNGKRQRRWFESEEDARRYVKQRKEDRNAFGVWFATMPARERAALGYQLQRLSAAGWTVEAAVDFVLSHGKNPPSIPLERVVDEFMTFKRAVGLRPCYLRKLKASMRRFLCGRERKPIGEITSTEILQYVACNGWKAATMRSYLVDVKTLFAFAVKAKYLRENPAEAVQLPRVDDSSTGILTVDQARALLDACIDHEPDALAVLVLCLFGGLRRSEAEQLDWTEVGPEFVEVKGYKAKTRRRRVIPIKPQLGAWLDCAKAAGSRLPACNFNNRFTRIVKHAGLHGRIAQNAARHSFASYHFAAHRNEHDTATVMGNSPQMIFGRYRELVLPADAEAFFALLPPPDAACRVHSAERRKSELRKPPPAPKERITAAIMAAIFDRGAKWLRRAEAAKQLVAACGCSIHSARKALTKQGRHWERIVVNAEGLVTWKPTPTPGAPQDRQDKDRETVDFPAVVATQSTDDSFTNRIDRL